MLILTRKPQQTIMVGDEVEITLLSLQESFARIGIQAPQDIRILRGEIYQREHYEKIVKFNYPLRVNEFYNK